MLVAKAYQHSSSAAVTEKMASPSSPTARRKRAEEGGKKGSSLQTGTPPSVLMPSPSMPSKPMVIPTRTKGRSKNIQKRQQLEYGYGTRHLPADHDANSINPSAAAYFAITSVDQEKNFIRGQRSTSINRNIPRQTDNRCTGTSVSSSSPQAWDLLLSPPEGDDFESSSCESETTLGLTSVSTTSMPSLVEDEESVDSSIVVTPSFSGSPRGDKRSKSLSTSLGEDCVLDHPLMPRLKSPDTIQELEKDMNPVLTDNDFASSSMNSFKSNLTASFRAIRSAARTITELAPPVRDDFLSRSILSLDRTFTDERRPVASSQPPDPALRRYLNPIQLSPAELHFHSDPDPVSCQSAVQLQSYRPGARQSPNASSPPIFVASEPKQKNFQLKKDALDTEDPFTSSLLPKQREPRENSDFLRVIVLEMNMRKSGKLSDSSPGRAKLWLPARHILRSEDDKKSGHDAGEQLTKRGHDGVMHEVPRRWAGKRP